MSLSYNVQSIPSTLVFETLTAAQITKSGKFPTIDAFLAENYSWGWTKPEMAHENYEDGRLERSVTRMHPRTESLIFATMFIDMGTITRLNWKEFYTRLYMYERTCGAMRRNAKGEPLFFTPEDVRLHIGLSCNVTETSKASYHARLANIMREGAGRAIREEERIKAEAEARA